MKHSIHAIMCHSDHTMLGNISRYLADLLNRDLPGKFSHSADSIRHSEHYSIILTAGYQPEISRQKSLKLIIHHKTLTTTRLTSHLESRHRASGVGVGISFNQISLLFRQVGIRPKFINRTSLKLVFHRELTSSRPISYIERGHRACGIVVGI